MASEVVVVRIYIHEADHGRRQNLMKEMLKILHDQHGVKGVTVFRGIAGLDEHGEVLASDMLRLIVDLPIVIEFFDAPAVIEAVLPLVSGLVPEGRILSWSARCH
jgi:hypothetical protein